MFDIFTPMEREEMRSRMALCYVDGIGPLRYRKLMQYFGSAQDVFRVGKKELKKVYGLGEALQQAIRSFAGFERMEEEIRYAETQGIQILFEEDAAYPQRLRLCPDAPPLLFYKGQANLNHPRMLAVVGTRRYTAYGRHIEEQLIEAMQPYDVMICSGLAFGIDAIAHEAALAHQLPTVAVVAHGLDTLYPSAHKKMAGQMLVRGGGLLTEYFSKTPLDRKNFPARNRIVAGMTDATLIIETDIKGGSMITAQLAASYNRDLFCIPGRITDPKSQGCLHLVKTLQAQLITDADDLLEAMGWKQDRKKIPKAPELFPELDPEESQVMTLLQEQSPLHLEVILQRLNWEPATLATILFQLELKLCIRQKPGKMVQLGG